MDGRLVSVRELARAAAHLGGPIAAPKRRLLAFAAFACAVLSLTSFAAHAESDTAHPVSAGARNRLLAQGRSLFTSSCAACHGTDAAGIAGRGPSLRGVGALAADFYLETGRMPLDSPRDQPTREPPAFPQSQIRALIAYVASFGGPRIPVVAPSQGSVSEGQRLFVLNCAGCHTIQGRGGIVTGAAVPALTQATPREIGEAIRIGPYAMPRFGSGEISNAQIDSIARYVQSTDHPADPGGWNIGRIGPISEGMVAWLLAATALLIVARLLGERSPDPTEEER